MHNNILKMIIFFFIYTQIQALKFIVRLMKYKAMLKIGNNVKL